MITLDEKAKIGEVQGCNWFTRYEVSTTTKVSGTTVDKLQHEKDEKQEDLEVEKERSIQA